MNAFALYEHRFFAMNTDVAAWIWSTPPHAETQLRAVETLFAEIEASLSRFRPQSELQRLNAAAGQGSVSVSATLWAVLVEAQRHFNASHGVFDPTILADLVHAGYDRSFEQGLDQPTPVMLAHHNVKASSLDRRLVLNAQARSVRLAAGVGLDLGGIAKGWTVDQAAERLGQWGPALVDAGGDIRVTAALAGEAWPIAVQDPFEPAQDLCVLRIAEGAVATSSIGKRHWRRSNQLQHHLIDPRRRRPAQSDLHTVTVLAPTAVEAEVAAKVALILGSHSGAAYLEAQGLTGLLFHRNGHQQQVGALPIDTELAIA